MRDQCEPRTLVFRIVYIDPCSNIGQYRHRENAYTYIHRMGLKPTAPMLERQKTGQILDWTAAVIFMKPFSS